MRAKFNAQEGGIRSDSTSSLRGSRRTTRSSVPHSKPLVFSPGALPSHRTLPLCEKELPNSPEENSVWSSAPHKCEGELKQDAFQMSSPTPEEKFPPADERPLTGLRVVVVEDEGITQMQLNRLLRQAGMEIVGAAGEGQTGVEVVLREAPDLVLMDIRMPLLDGLEATRQILATTQVCIVMLTAYADESLRAKALQLGASGYLLKPITSLTLIPQLEKVYAAYKTQHG